MNVFPIENGDFLASHVSLLEGSFMEGTVISWQITTCFPHVRDSQRPKNVNLPRPMKPMTVKKSGAVRSFLDDIHSLKLTART